MRLLIAARMSLALRRVTSTTVSSAATTASATVPTATSGPRIGRKTSRSPVSTTDRRSRSKVAATHAAPQPDVQQKLWDLSKVRWEIMSERILLGRVIALSGRNDFTLIAEILEEYDRSEKDKLKVRSMQLVSEVIWTALHAKSLGALPPSLLKWIEDAVIQLPELNAALKDMHTWLLSILREDWPLLQELQQKSWRKRGKIGPVMRREEVLQYLALAYLQDGKNEEFKSLWSSLRIPPLPEDTPLQRPAALMYHTIQRSVKTGKSDPAMLRWYAEEMVNYQRTPIYCKPQFSTMMEPMIRAFGGRIEKWSENDHRKEKLRKWRADYDDRELYKLAHSFLDYMMHLIDVKKHGSPEDLVRLKQLLIRLDENETKVVVIDWLNLCGSTINRKEVIPIDSILPGHSLVVVGIERKDIFTRRLPMESSRVKVMEVTSHREIKWQMDDLWSIFLSLFTRGHLLTNDMMKPQIENFKKYLLDESKDVNQAIRVENWLNDARLRHNLPWLQKYESILTENNPNGGLNCDVRRDLIQLPVDHSRAAQWIDKEKKELAFTVARRMDHLPPDTPFKQIDCYSLHID